MEFNEMNFKFLNYIVIFFMCVYVINKMPSKMSNRVSSAAKRASNRVSKGVSKSVKSVKSMSSEKIVSISSSCNPCWFVMYYIMSNKKEVKVSLNLLSQLFIYLFYVDWCPHCKTAKPKMAEVQKNLAKNNNKVNGNDVIIEMVNCEGIEKEKELVNIREMDVKAYPTISTKNGSKLSEYENNFTKILKLGWANLPKL